MGVRIFDMELFFNEAVEATEQRCSPKKVHMVEREVG